MKQAVEIPQKGNLIIITERRCSDKVSPLIEVGKKYIVKRVEILKGGTTVIEILHPNRKKATLRVNESRFSWKLFTGEMAREELLRKSAENGVKELKENFDIIEQMKIVFVPLVFNHIAWIYALRAKQDASTEKIDLLKKASREVTKLRKNYITEISKDLNWKHQLKIEEETERFMKEFSRDFTILWFSVLGEVNKNIPDYPYENLRCNAIISMLMIKFVDEHNKNMDKMLKERIGKVQDSIRMPIMDELYSYMNVYAGEIGKFDYNNTNIKMSMKIIGLAIDKIEFNVEDD